MLKTVKLLLEEASDARLRRIYLSIDAIQRRISDMPKDVKDQVINEIKASPTPMFSFPVDLSTYVTSCAQLLAFVRYILSGDIKKEFLFCKELQATTTSVNVS